MRKSIEKLNVFILAGAAVFSSAAFPQNSPKSAPPSPGKRGVKLIPTPSTMLRKTGETIFLEDSQCLFDSNPKAKNASTPVDGLPDVILVGC